MKRHNFVIDLDPNADYLVRDVTGWDYEKVLELTQHGASSISVIENGNEYEMQMDIFYDSDGRFVVTMTAPYIEHALAVFVHAMKGELESSNESYGLARKISGQLHRARSQQEWTPKTGDHVWYRRKGTHCRLSGVIAHWTAPAKGEADWYSVRLQDGQVCWGYRDQFEKREEGEE